ncbi:MAG: CehA/McbA family metallohydrolase [Clostridia bacterium]|nr:CehA/McbA family metallohydrolase [Clostridia bacterium]
MKLMQTRREFLKMAGKGLAGGLAVAAAPVLVTGAQAAAANMATAGIVRGKVTDTNSCMMPAVILVEAADGTAYRAFTNAMGGYAISLEPGEYTLTFSKGHEYEMVTRTIEVESLKTYYLQDVRLQPLYDSYAKGWIAGDCHQHTFYSDGVDPVEDVMIGNAANGLYFGFLTDHNTSRGVPEYNGACMFPVRTENDQVRYFKGMDGVEVTSEFGHYNALGSGLTLETYDLKFTEAERNSPEKMQIVREKIKYIADCITRVGSVAQMNHPYSTTTMGMANWIDANDYEVFDMYDTMELWNGYFCPPDGALFDTQNSMNQNYSAKLLWYGLLNAMKDGHAFHAITGGTDNHDVSGAASAKARAKIAENPADLQSYYDTWVASAKYNGMPATYTYFGDKELTMENAMAAVKAGHSFVTSGPIALCDIKGKIYGEKVEAAAGEELTLNCDIWNRDGLKEVRIVVNGEIVQKIPCTGDTFKEAVSLKRDWTACDWVVVEVLGENCCQYAITNPIIIA